MKRSRKGEIREEKKWSSSLPAIKNSTASLEEDEWAAAGAGGVDSLFSASAESFEFDFGEPAGFKFNFFALAFLAGPSRRAVANVYLFS